MAAALACSNSSILRRRSCTHPLGGRRCSSAAADARGGAILTLRTRREEGFRGEALKVRVGPRSRPDMSARPMSMAMEAISAVEELDQVLEEAQQLSLVVIIDWVAGCCRKCIYLKPKLEKLAAEYYPRVRFYLIDVNKVSQELVKRGNITKMPAIQLWRDKEWEEVIGGHKPWLVIDEVWQMIQKHT